MARHDGSLPHSSRRAGLVALAAVLAACATDPGANEGVTAVQFQDVVVPNGMRLKAAGHESASIDASGYRQARFEYVGQADVQVAADYVRERMPQHNWAKVTDEAVAEVGQKIRFERGIYRADYTFARSEGLTIMVVDYSTDYTRR